MEKCKDLFNKLIKKLNNCNSFEEYYNLLKKDNYEYLFCESYLSSKKETYAYKHFFEKVNSLTIFFKKELSGIPRKSWIGIKLPNHPYYLAIFFALLRNNFNVLLLDNKGSKDYFDYVIKNSNLRAIIANVPIENDSVKFVSFQDIVNFKVKANDSKCEIFSNKIAICTSGTTGSYNIIVFSGEQIIHQIKSILKVLSNSPIEEMSIGNNIKFLIFPPLHHIFGFISLLFYSSIGVTNVMCKQTLSSFISTIKSAKVDWTGAVPLVWESLINFIKGKYKAVNTSTIRKTIGNNLNFCFSAGASVSSAVIKLFNDSKIIFCNCYGMTEAGGMITWNLGKTEAERTNGSIGTIKSSSCKIGLLSQSGEIVRKGVGELLISGKGVYTSVLKNGKEIYRTPLDSNNFIKTGDLVEIRDEKIYFLDRIKDIIINSSGENISTSELEKYFASSLENINFTILGLNDCPSIVIFIKDEKTLKECRESLINRIIKQNKGLPLNKKVMSVYFTAKPFPTTSALKIKKYELKNLIKSYPENYVDVKLINSSKNLISLKSIITDLKKFFSTYLNTNLTELKNETLIIEDLNVDSLIMAELLIYIEEKYNINIEKEFMLEDSLSIVNIAKMILNKI